MRYLLDTNTCIYIIKRSPEHVYQRFKRLHVGDVGISAITFCELQFGVSNSVKREKNQLALTEFLGPLDVIDFPAGSPPIYGNIRAYLRRGNEFDRNIGDRKMGEGGWKAESWHSVVSAVWC